MDLAAHALALAFAGVLEEGAKPDVSQKDPNKTIYG